MCTRELMRRVSDASEFPVLQSNSPLLLDSVYDFVFSLSCFEQYPSLFVFSFPSFYVRIVPCPEIRAWEASHKCVRTLFKTTWIPETVSCAVVSNGKCSANLTWQLSTCAATCRLFCIAYQLKGWKEPIVHEKNLLLGCSYHALRVTTWKFLCSILRRKRKPPICRFLVCVYDVFLL